MIIFQSFLFSKECHACIGCLGYLPKLKRVLTNFQSTFSKIISYLLYYVFYQLTYSPSQDITLIVFNQLIMWYTSRFFFNNHLEQWQTEGKREEIQKIEYLGNGKSFLNKIKTIFRNFLRAIIWWMWKKEKQPTQAFKL